MQDDSADQEVDRIIDEARDILEEQLRPFLVEFTVSDKLTLSTHKLQEAPSRLAWDGVAYFPFWQEELRIDVYTDGHAPGDEQVAVLRTMLEHPHCIREEVLTAFVRFYNRIVYPNRENFRSVMELPIVQTAEEIYALIGDPSATVDRKCKTDSVRFQLTFSPDWQDGGITQMYLADWKVIGEMFGE